MTGSNNNSDIDNSTSSSSSMTNDVPNANGGMSLPHYLVTISHNNNPLSQPDIVEEQNEEGDGGDSDDDGEAALELVNAHLEVQRERSGHESFASNDDDVGQVADDTEDNAVLLSSENDGEEIAIEELNFPKPPEDWVDPEPNRDRDEPLFSSIDNPGKWSSYA